MQIYSTGHANANDDDAPKDENGDENTPQTNNDGANIANIDFNASTDAEQGQDDPIFIPNAYLVPFSGHGGEHEANNNDNAEDDLEKKDKDECEYNEEYKVLDNDQHKLGENNWHSNKEEHVGSSMRTSTTGGFIVSWSLL